MADPRPDALPIRRAVAADATALSAFAARTFHDAFADDNTPDDMAAYLAVTFTPARQAAELADPTSAVLLAEAPPAGDAAGLAAPIAGYAHLVFGDAPSCVAGPAPVELRRFYVAREWQGRGLAHALMREAVAEAVRRGARTLWLGVWERNPRAVSFYRKVGFHEVGTQSFRLGADLQTDLVMVRSLT